MKCKMKRWAWLGSGKTGSDGDDFSLKLSVLYPAVIHDPVAEVRITGSLLLNYSLMSGLTFVRSAFFSDWECLASRIFSLARLDRFRF